LVGSPHRPSGSRSRGVTQVASDVLSGLDGPAHGLLCHAAEVGADLGTRANRAADGAHGRHPHLGPDVAGAGERGDQRAADQVQNPVAMI
jgi:hypothetical protein